MTDRQTGVTPKSAQSTYRSIEDDLIFLQAAGFPDIHAWNQFCALWHLPQGVTPHERARRRTGYPRTGLDQLDGHGMPDSPTIERLIVNHDIQVNFAGIIFGAGVELILDAAAASKFGPAGSAGTGQTNAGYAKSTAPLRSLDRFLTVP